MYGWPNPRAQLRRLLAPRPVSRLVVPPVGEPITLQQAKDHLRLEHGLDDNSVPALVTAARQYVEEVCWRGLLRQTWELVLCGFPWDCGFVELPRGNLASVESVSYVDLSGGTQTWNASNYSVDTGSVPGRVLPAWGTSWPSTRDQWDAVVIRYVVGWRRDDPAFTASGSYASGDRVRPTTPDGYSYEAQGAGAAGAEPSWPTTVGNTVVSGAVTFRNMGLADPVPTPIRQAMLLLISQMYEHRTPEVVGTIVSQVQFAVDALLSPYRLLRFE
jgi:uncharacterized phiE125 gp8 family phage protein